MKKCANCEREAMDAATFCQFCGAKFPIEEKPLASESLSQENDTQNIAPPLPEPVGYTESSSQNSQNQSPPANNGLVWLIISSVLAFFGCFCYGLGLLQVPTIVTSAISVSKYNRGDYEGSKKMSKTSMILFFSILAFSILIIIGIVIWFYSFMDLSDFGSIVDEFY